VFIILGRGTSALSIFSTTAEENQTLRLASFPKEEEPRVEDQSMEVEGVAQHAAPETGEADVSMEIDVVDEAEVGAALTKPSSDIAPSPSLAPPLDGKEDIISSESVVKEENGKFILEKLDTPAIRKEKAQRKKQERDRRKKQEKKLAEIAKTRSKPGADLDTDLQESASPGAGPSRLLDEGASEDMDVEIEAGSELSELSEVGSGDVQPPRKASGRTRVQPSRATRSRADPEPGAVVLPEGTMLEGGTLGMSWNLLSFRDSFSMCWVSVWAKACESLKSWLQE
jgi:hypothetical protein